MIKLYGATPSPYTRKTQLAFAHRGIEYDLILTQPGSDDAAFRAISPLGKIPAIETPEGHRFADSSVILAYYEKTHAPNPLYPVDPGLFAEALFLEEYADTKLSEVASALYFQTVLAPAFYGREPDAARVEDLRSHLVPAQLALLESLIPSDEGWLVGKEYSVADVAVGSNLASLWHAGFEIDAQAYPHTAAFFQRFMSRDDVKTQLATEKQALDMASVAA